MQCTTFLFAHVNESEDTSLPPTDYIYVRLNMGTNQSAVTERKSSETLFCKYEILRDE